VNLPEYRRAYRMAQERFQGTVNEASEDLAKAFAAADEQFFEYQEKAIAVERDEYAETRRGR
jgi:hypothetical protein